MRAPDPPDKHLVLIVDDEKDTRALLELSFGNKGFRTHSVPAGRAALAAAKQLLPSAVVLDFGLPDITGLEVVKALKNDPETSGIVVLVATGNDLHGREVVCLDDGADDYLVKGKDTGGRAVARVRALLRLQRPSPTSNRLTVGPVTLDWNDPNERKAYVNGESTKTLTPKEFQLLDILMRNSPQVLGWAELGRAVDDVDPAPDKAGGKLRVHLSHLKAKLGSVGAACIITHRQTGLQFADASRASPASASA